jgi:hypothetical protein
VAEQNPPFVIQASSHPADAFRRMVKALRSQAGVVGIGDMAVTQNGTPDMSVNVAAGQAIIDGTESAVLQGSYVVTNDAVVNKAIAASDPTNPRNDLVIAKVQDAVYSGATNAWSLAVLTGTPAGSPVDPALPANAIALARVRVDALVTTIVNAKITDLRADIDAAIFPGAAGWTLWDSTGALKNAFVTDAGIWLLRNALELPPAAGVALPAHSYGTVPVKLDEQSTASAAFVTLTVPAGALYRALQLMITGKSDQATGQVLLAQFNADTGANYDSQQGQDINATWSATAPTIAGTSGTVGALTATGGAAGSVAAYQALIQNAGSTTLRKAWDFRGGHWNTDAAASAVHVTGQGQWRNAANAITSIKLFSAAGNLINFRAILMGIP